MSLIEGIGDEVINFFFILISVIVLYIAWRSTNVRDERLPRTTVLIIESNRRRMFNRVAQHPVTISILRSASQRSNASNDDADELELDEDPTSSDQIDDLQISEPPSLQSILDEVEDLTVGATYTSTSTTPSNDSVDLGPQEIIREMDSDNTDGMRRRRVPFYENNSLGEEQNTTTSETGATSTSQVKTTAVVHKSSLNHQDSTDKSANTDNCTNENSENGNVFEEVPYNPMPSAPTVEHVPLKSTIISKENEFRIKLKYLNDDLKMVKGTPNEAVGDFKKRNFSVELSDQKLVRLVFNGHVLQPDSKTLKACGLFDNCVVHCLVHNQRPSATATINSSNAVSEEGGTQSGLGFDSLNGNTGNFSGGQRLILFGMFLIGLTLVFCWYFRIQYYHLFSWYSTIGLILLTALFMVIAPLLYLIEREIAT